MLVLVCGDFNVSTKVMKKIPKIEIADYISNQKQSYISIYIRYPQTQIVPYNLSISRHKNVPYFNVLYYQNNVEQGNEQILSHIKNFDLYQLIDLYFHQMNENFKDHLLKYNDGHGLHLPILFHFITTTIEHKSSPTTFFKNVINLRNRPYYTFLLNASNRKILKKMLSTI